MEQNEQNEFQVKSKRLAEQTSHVSSHEDRHVIWHGNQERRQYSFIWKQRAFSLIKTIYYGHSD